jgi:Na+-transporting methylmalonyl-CoA/oxaloacetate decarboxylase gamma subunit
MITFYSNLEPLLKIYWGVALFSSLIFIIQAIMTFIGAGNDAADADFSGDGGDGSDGSDGSDMPFQIFSFRNLIHFLLGFSWTGISFYQLIHNKILLSFIGIVVGLLFVFLFFVIIKFLMKLAENNSFRIEKTIGKTAEVYLTIPPQKEGKGKIIVSVNGAVHELQAMTEANEKITTGAVVKITAVIDDIVIVNQI